MSNRRHQHLENVAYHEAGHAVIASWYELPFEYITIKPTDDSLGHVYHDFSELLQSGFSPESYSPDSSDDYATRYQLENMIKVAFAGVLAERRYTAGRYNWQGAKSDLLQIAGYLTYLTGSAKQSKAYERLLRVQVEELIATPERWDAIERLATSLLKQETMPADEARRIICDPELLLMIERLPTKDIQRGRQRSMPKQNRCTHDP